MDGESTVMSSNTYEIFTKTVKNVYEVSVIIVTYNPIWDKLRKTLESIITQKNIDMQIVISDDGSKNDYFTHILDFFYEKNFEDFIVIRCSENKGTVSNILRAVENARGNYVKTISPGDYMFYDNAIRLWIDKIKEDNAKWSFCDAVYYVNKKNIEPIQVKAHPQFIKPYLKHKDSVCMWNYVVLNDIVLGAAVLSERKIAIDYLKRIVGKVKYAEDNMWRLMMFDGIVGCYFPSAAIMYEYGTGVSTVKNEMWKKRIEEDWNTTNVIMQKYIRKGDKLQIKMVNAINAQKKHKILIKNMLIYFIKTHFFARKTPIDV